MEMLRITICDVMKIGTMDGMFKMMEMGTARVFESIDLCDMNIIRYYVMVLWWGVHWQYRNQYGTLLIGSEFVCAQGQKKKKLSCVNASVVKDLNMYLF